MARPAPLPAVTRFPVLGVVTKSVAVAFLPAVWVTALLVRADAFAQLRGTGRDWIVASLAGSRIIA